MDFGSDLEDNADNYHDNDDDNIDDDNIRLDQESSSEDGHGSAADDTGSEVRDESTSSSSPESDDGHSDDMNAELPSSGAHSQSSLAEIQAGMMEMARLDAQMLQKVQASASADLEKGKHTRNQLSLYDGLLDVRIRSQRCLHLVNCLPTYDQYPYYVKHGAESAVALQEKLASTKQHLRSLIHTLLQVKVEMMRSSEELYTATIGKEEELPLPVVSVDTLPTSSDALWRLLSSVDDQVLHPFRDQVVEKWNRKVQVASAAGSLLQKKLKAVNQSIPQQIQHLLTSDTARLVKRTQMLRSQQQQHKVIGRIWKRKRDHEPESSQPQQQQQQGYEEEIFDDNDYYSTVLRELIDSKMDDVDDPLALSMHWAKIKELQRSSKKRRENVDRKASKGRRLR